MKGSGGWRRAMNSAGVTGAGRIGIGILTGRKPKARQVRQWNLNWLSRNRVSRHPREGNNSSWSQANAIAR